MHPTSVAITALVVILSAAKDPLLYRNLHQPPPTMPINDDCYVYILSSRSRTLYIGVTNNLLRRVTQHRQRKAGSFVTHNNIHRLVHFEHFRYINNALTREKQLKGWLRARKITLIEETNPTWRDLPDDLIH